LGHLGLLRDDFYLYLLLSKSEQLNRCDAVVRSPTFRVNRGLHLITLLVVNLAIRLFDSVYFLFLGPAAQRGLRPPNSRVFVDHTQQCITVVRTPLDE